MKRPFEPPTVRTAARALRTVSLAGLATFLFATSTRADDRFIVPSSPDSSSSSNNYSPPPPPPSPPPSPPPASSGPTYSPPPYTPPPSNDSGGRFIVPNPGPSYPSDGNSGYNPGGGYSSGGGYPSGGNYTLMPYWGGCYYWGGSYYYWGGYRYNPRYGWFGYDSDFSSNERYSNRNDRRVERAAPIFFPPSPPPIGAPPPPKQPPVERTAAPKDLASYVFQPFYAPLSTRLYSKDLSKKLLSRLENFRTKHTALRNELVNKLASLKDLSAAERTQQLEAFAREQTPRLVELENTAEQLRSDLLHSGLVGLISGTGDWNETRQWRLGGNQTPNARSRNLVQEFLVMRAAIFYQDGLSPAQRRLLREVAMELQVEAFKPTSQANRVTSDDTLLYFSPETARIRIPEDLPAELAAKIDLYQTEKNRIKSELRDKLYLLDSASDSKRTQALKQLAEQQATAIAALDLLADEIRAGFAALPKPPGPATPPAFPPELATRINSYLTEKQAVQKNLQTRLEEIRQQYAPEARRLSPKNSNEMDYRLDGAGRVSPEGIARMREAINLLNKANAQRFAQLDREKEAIRSAVASYASAHRTAEGEPSVQSLLSSFLTALREEESWLPYKDYQTAVYQPGLSSEQRRLLFEIALEKLALPLPEGEF